MESNEVAQKVRIHKHNYAGEFGNVVIEPIKALLGELIANPTIFDEKEREEILQSVLRAYQAKGMYDILGYNVTEQLDVVQDKLIYPLNTNRDLMASILSKNRDYKDPFLVTLLQWSICNTYSLSSKINKIECDDKGEVKPIRVIEIIEKEFEEDKDARSRKGMASFVLQIYGRRECSNVFVKLDPDTFKTAVIHNIVDNIHKHAFSDFDNNKNISFFSNTNKHNWIDKLKSIFSHKNEVDKDEESEKIVQILYSLDDNFIKIEIENNGKIFQGDVSKVFDYRVGNGEGIGMFSAAEFLKANGGSIRMETDDNSEYKVKFIIKIPIYYGEI